MSTQPLGPGRRALPRLAAIAFAVIVSMSEFLASPVAADSLVVISITGGSPQTICDTAPLVDCVTVTEGDLILCRPTAIGGSGEIVGCDWEILFDGDDSAVPDDQEINLQMRALEIAPNGNLAFVMNGTDTIPGNILKSNDINVFQPNDVLSPYVGNGPYTTATGTTKVYLDGVLSQQDVSAKPWDALEILPDGSCENAITANLGDNGTCDVIGSLSGGDTSGNFGINFHNEDLIRCIPTSFSNGAVQSCDYAVMLDSTALNGGGSAGISSDIEAIDFLAFDTATMSGQMVFQKKSGNPTGFPAHEAGRDLLLYDGTFGSGICSVTTSVLCAGDADCPGGETCETGTCSLTPAVACATDEDCAGASNACNHTRPYTATVTLFFDGSAVGLSGTGQKIEAFSIVPDGDGDIIPDGPDNCPNIANPPSVCSGGVATCPGGLSSECPGGELCVQADADGDGVGDPCDQCNGRDDAVCECGDNVLDMPSEQCDLGDNNSIAGPCSPQCTISGSCTGTAAQCTVAADCLPPGQGCCGNGIVEAPEDCDDGNTIEDDHCFGNCSFNATGTDLLGCDNLVGPNVVPGFVKLTKFKDSKDQPDLDRWKTKGEFIVEPGQPVDPDSQSIAITFSNNLSGEIFASTMIPVACTPIPCFVQSGVPTKEKWKFKDKEADVPGAPSWRKGKVSRKLTKYKFNLDGRNVTLMSNPDLDVPPSLRQTIRIGDTCITSVLDCEIKPSGKTVKCESAP